MALRPGFTVESMKDRGVGKLPGLIGIELLAVEAGLLVAEVKVRPDLLAPNGYLHAATVVALADTMCGFGCISHLPEGASGFTTIELKSNFLGTALDGTIYTEARPQHLGSQHTAVGRRRTSSRNRQNDCALSLHPDGAVAHPHTRSPEVTGDA